MYVLQQLINGLSQGSIYALMAIGYTLIVGVVGLITFAYGEMVMIGAMSAYLFYTYVTPNFFLGLLVALHIFRYCRYLHPQGCLRALPGRAQKHRPAVHGGLLPAHQEPGPDRLRLPGQRHAPRL